MNFMQNSVYFCLYSELASVAAYIGLFQKKSKQGEDGGGGGEDGGGGGEVGGGWGVEDILFFTKPLDI